MFISEVQLFLTHLRWQDVFVQQAWWKVIIQAQLQALAAYIDVIDVEGHFLAGSEASDGCGPDSQFKSINNPLNTWLNLHKNAKLSNTCHNSPYLLSDLIALVRVGPRVYELLVIHSLFLFLVVLPLIFVLFIYYGSGVKVKVLKVALVAWFEV